jgi:hypothetical protein
MLQFVEYRGWVECVVFRRRNYSKDIDTEAQTINLPSECDLHFIHDAFKDRDQLFHGAQPFYFCCLDKTNAIKKCTNLYI